jgi:hypothetical protein
MVCTHRNRLYEKVVMDLAGGLFGLFELFGVLLTCDGHEIHCAHYMYNIQSTGLNLALSGF